MRSSFRKLVESYKEGASLAEACAPPAAWYTDPRIFELEQRTVFCRSWQTVGRADQVRERGQYITAEITGEPILVVRGGDDVLRGFFNVCRHKGAAIMTEREGRTQNLRCPYHGWTYSLEGELKGTPDFAGVRNFDPSANGLVPCQTALWQNWLFVKVETHGQSLERFLGAHLHRELNSVLDYSQYTIETGERFCLQSSPIVNDRGDSDTAAVRRGDRAHYFWIYPNFMINWCEGAMDTNLVIPRGIDRTEVIFDFYFETISEQAREQTLASIAVSERIQAEDVAICESVKRGLASRAYKPGRLSVRREAGEHLFHK